VKGDRRITSYEPMSISSSLHNGLTSSDAFTPHKTLKVVPYNEQVIFENYNNLLRDDPRGPWGLRRRIVAELDVCFSVSWCCVGRCLCDRPITRPGEFYNVCVCVWGGGGVRNNNNPLHL
jgi:hypothetical protein